MYTEDDNDYYGYDWEGNPDDLEAYNDNEADDYRNEGDDDDANEEDDYDE